MRTKEDKNEENKNATKNYQQAFRKPRWLKDCLWFAGYTRFLVPKKSRLFSTQVKQQTQPLQVIVLRKI